MATGLRGAIRRFKVDKQAVSAHTIDSLQPCPLHFLQEILVIDLTTPEWD